VELSHAESGGGAVRLLGARGGELRAGRNVGEIANSLRAIGRDDEMRLAPFPREFRQKRTDDALVVGVSENCEDRSACLGRRR
jgi:hypothetical protein